MAKAKDRPATPAKTAKPAGSKTPGARPMPPRQPQEASSFLAGNGERPTPEQLYRMIQETAYFKAKARNFAPGREVQDWIEAEAEVRERLESRA